MKTVARLSLKETARGDFRDRMSLLRALAGDPPADVLERFVDLEERLAALSHEDHARLLVSPLTWAQEDHDAARWLRHSSEELGVIGYRLWESLHRRNPGGDLQRQMMARTLVHLGDAAKWDGVVSSESERDFRRLHAMMRAALAGGFQAKPVPVGREGGATLCSVEALYFRTLLLARFSSGTFGFKQLEILDQWMWMWTPVLAGTAEPPQGGAFRADLDSSHGLRPGARADAGPCRYLPVAPIQRAYAAIVAQFHQGRIVPSEGVASRFRIEEYVAVLDFARRGLQGVAATRQARARRIPQHGEAELLVGLGEILERGFEASRPAAAPTQLSLAAIDGEPAARAAYSADRAIDGLYERGRRIVRMVDTSTSGFGIEGDARDLGHFLVGDLVALRCEEGRPPRICKVARHSPMPDATRIFVGLKSVSSAAYPMTLSRPGASRAHEAELKTAFVPGSDPGGRHDAWLVSEREFASRATLEAGAADRRFAMRFNRVRDRGPGWVLAGFEVLSASRAAA